MADEEGYSFSGNPSGYWGNDPDWQKLSSYEKAAAMAILEADVVDGRPDFTSAKNVLGAMINRADRDGSDLGAHVSGKIYQPTIEPVQYSRLAKVVALPQFKALTNLAQQRDEGAVEDWVGGATHFLAHEHVMKGLQAAEPNKYRSWVNWTGYAKNGQYANPDGSPVMRDRSHAFLAPEGRHSANRAPLVDTSAYHDADILPMSGDPSGASVTSESGAPATRRPQADVEEARTGQKLLPKLPSLSQALFGVEKPVLGNMLGLTLQPGGKFVNPLAMSSKEEAAGMTLPAGERLDEPDERAFQVAAAQRKRPPPVPVRQRRTYGG